MASSKKPSDHGRYAGRRAPLPPLAAKKSAPENRGRQFGCQ